MQLVDEIVFHEKKPFLYVFPTEIVNAVLEFLRNNSEKRTDMKRTFQKNVIFSSPKQDRREFVRSLIGF